MSKYRLAPARRWFFKTPQENVAPAPPIAGPDPLATYSRKDQEDPSLHDKDALHRYFLFTSTESLTLVHKVIGEILHSR